MATGDQVAVYDEHYVAASAVSERGQRGRKAVVRQAGRSAVVDGMRMVMVRQPFEPIPFSSCERIDRSGNAQMLWAMHHGEMAEQCACQASAVRRLAVDHNGVELRQRDR